MNINRQNIEISQRLLCGVDSTQDEFSHHSPFEAEQELSTPSNLQSTVKTKRRRRSKIEMEIVRAQGKNMRNKNCHTVANAPSVNAHFTDLQYSRNCSYIENDEQYNELFSGGNKTKVNGNVITKSQALEKFAKWMILCVVSTKTKELI